MVYQYIFPPIAGNPQTVPYAALVPYALVTNRWYIIFWVRYSPYTVVVTTYHSQEIRIHYCWTTLLEILSDAGKLPENFKCNEHAKVFGSDEEISRWTTGSRKKRGAPSTMQSKSFKEMITLLEDLAKKDPGLNVMIVAKNPGRVAVEPTEFENILSKIREANKMTQVLFTECFGVNPTGPTGWVKRNYEVLRKKKEMSKRSSNLNPAKDVPRESWGEKAEERISENAVGRMKELIVGESKVATELSKGVKRGESLQIQNKSRVLEVTSARKEAQKKGRSPSQSADDIVKKFKPETVEAPTGEAGEGKYNVSFLRWSPQWYVMQHNSRHFTKEGAHCRQAAYCMELMRDEEVLEKFDVVKDGKLIVIMDKRARRDNVNDGLSLVLRLVLDDQVNAVFVHRYNRINCRIFKEICELMNVPIIAMDCLGLEIDDYMTAEESRVEQNSASLKEFKIQNKKEAETVLAGYPLAAFIYNEMYRYSHGGIGYFLVEEGLQNLTFGKSGALDRRRVNREEYLRNKRGTDGHSDEDDYDSDYDDSDSEEEELD